MRIPVDASENSVRFMSEIDEPEVRLRLAVKEEVEVVEARIDDARNKFSEATTDPTREAFNKIARESAMAVTSSNWDDKTRAVFSQMKLTEASNL